MTIRIRRHCVIAGIVFAVACSGQTGDQEPDRPAASQAGFDSAATRLLTALRTNAVDSIVALMADDVVLMPPHEPLLRGKAAVRTWIEQFLSQLRTSAMTLSNREVLLNGDQAIEIASYDWQVTPVGGGAPMAEQGTYLQVWQRQADGRWLCIREIWNSTTPMPASGGS